MRIIKPATYSILIILWLTLIFSTVNAFAGSTINSTSGNNTAIEGGYTGGATTYQDGSSSNSTTNSTSTSNIKSAPYTSSAPSINTSNNCALSLSGGLQTFSIGVSGGKSYIDKTCELVVLSRTLQSFGMKVAAIALLCQDERVFKAMSFASGTPCPIEGKIGDEAKKLLAEKYNYEMPTYEKYVELELKKKKITHKKTTKIHK
jgi:hypothetical protein|tara:strand:- start:228 stop:839 length:612 start_codon:yes stop_codon:yes gene_type:complete